MFGKHLGSYMFCRSACDFISLISFVVVFTESGPAILDPFLPFEYASGKRQLCAPRRQIIIDVDGRVTVLGVVIF